MFRAEEERKRRIRYLKKVLNQCMKLQRGQAYDSSSGSRWFGLSMFESMLDCALDERWGEDSALTLNGSCRRHENVNEYRLSSSPQLSRRARPAPTILT